MTIDKIYATPSVLKELESFPENIKLFFEETKSYIPNAYFYLQSLAEYNKLMGTSIGHYFAFTRLAPLPRGMKTNDGVVKRDYLATIVTPTPINITDLAHEICHYYLHGAINYPYVWDFSNGINVDEPILTLRNYASRLYDIAVHPTIDLILKEKNLLFPGFYDRLYSDFKDTIKTYLKLEPTLAEKAKTRLIIRTIEVFNRLPIKYINKIEKKHGNNTQFIDLIEEVNKFPKFNVKPFDPQSCFNFVNCAWDYLLLDRNIIELDILWSTPILLRRETT